MLVFEKEKKLMSKGERGGHGPSGSSKGGTVKGGDPKGGNPKGK